MWRFLHNAIELKDELLQFLRDPKSKLLELYDKLSGSETWEVAEIMLGLCETFKLAVEGIEGDSYGSLGHVFESLRMIEKAVHDAGSRIPALLDKWKMTKKVHWDERLTEQMKEQLRMATILSFRFRGIGQSGICESRECSEEFIQQHTQPASQ
jgi:hypothetical protein